MVNKRKPIPKTQREISESHVNPYLPELGNPNAVEKNRSNETSVKNDEVKDFSIGLEDIDNAIIFYFENIIKPFINFNSQRINVPIIYGSPERWKAVQSDGFYRDKNGKTMTPLIMFKRESVEKNRNLGNKLDSNEVRLFETYEKPYSKRNYYDNFGILNNTIPQKERYGIIIPDYVTISYSCIIWTDFVENMNNIVESINFASDSYWGDKERFQFRARIDNFNTTTELIQGKDRAIKTNFNIIMNGYIIPNTINKNLNSINKWYSKSKVIFNSEVVKDIKNINL